MAGQEVVLRIVWPKAEVSPLGKEAKAWLSSWNIGKVK